MRVPKEVQTRFCQEIQKIFEDRKRTNPAYSMRAFSRSLGIDSSTLSQILRQKRPLSERNLLRLVNSLKLDVDKFTVCPKGSPYVQWQLPQLDYLEAERISHWVYDAIIELLEASPEPPKASDVARDLDLPQTRIDAALMVLKDLGFVSEDKQGLHNHLGSTTNIDENIEADSAKQYQESLLEKSQEALWQIPKSKRDHTSYMVALDPQDFDLARKAIAECRQRLMQLAENTSRRHSKVYAFQFSAFPVSKVSEDFVPEGGQYDE